MLSTSTEEKLEVVDDGVSPPLENPAFSPSLDAGEFAMCRGTVEFSTTLGAESMLTICHVTRRGRWLRWSTLLVLCCEREGVVCRIRAVTCRFLVRADEYRGTPKYSMPTRNKHFSKGIKEVLQE